MEFTIQRDIFAKALQRIQGIVEKRNTMPILSNVLIEAVGDKIELTATDLEVGMKSSYETTVVKEGKITVSAKKLYEIIKELSDEEIRFSTRDNDWVNIQCGKAAFNIVGLSPDEFPYFPKINDDNFLTLTSSLLNEMIEKTAHAICFDDTKYNLNGIFVKAEENDGQKIIKFVATDGHRLAYDQKSFSGTVSAELSKGIIFPRKGIVEMKKISEEEATELSIGFLDNSAVIKKGTVIVVMRLVDGEFPDYTRVIPQHNDKIFTVNRELFYHALKRMAILSSEKSKGVKLELDGDTMTISSSNPELGEAREEIPILFDGTPTVAGFNARYLIDSLSVITDESIKVFLKDELSPAIVTPQKEDGFFSVIMPMRL